MSHYFHTPTTKARNREFSATIFGQELCFATADGVFSGNRLDPGTAVLLREVAPPQSGRVLDLGCGVGTIAVSLAVASPSIQVDAIDTNARAVELTVINAARHGVADRVRAMAPEAVPAQVRYQEIWSNPPIRIGKLALHGLLLSWLARLAPDGAAYLVVGKHLGSDSLQRWLTSEGYAARRLASAKGFRVLRVTWPEE